MKKDFPLKDEFKNHLISYYNCSISSEDFGRGEEVKSKVNEWAAKMTNNLIPKFLESTPDQDEVMMLLNAIYFKGTWMKPFDKSNTREMVFNNFDGSQAKVKMMKDSEVQHNFADLSDKHNVKVILKKALKCDY